MINLVISKSNSNESLSQIKAEAMRFYLMANNDKKACLQHLFKAENSKQKEKAMAGTTAVFIRISYLMQ